MPQVDAGKTKQNSPESTTRQVQASQVDIDFTTGPDRRPQAEHILAAGGARLNVHTIYTKTPPEDTTVQGDQLFATLVDGEILSSLRGTGHTSLVTVSPNGVTQSSKGDNLLLTFAPPHPAAKPKARRAKENPIPPAAAGRAAAVCSAVGKRDSGPTGRGEPPAAKLRLRPPPPPSEPPMTQLPRSCSCRETRASRKASGELSANLIEIERTSGNANATGGVKATYRQTNGQAEHGLCRVRAGARGRRPRPS